MTTPDEVLDVFHRGKINRAVRFVCSCYIYKSVTLTGVENFHSNILSVKPQNPDCDSCRLIFAAQFLFGYEFDICIGVNYTFNMFEF